MRFRLNFVLMMAIAVATAGAEDAARPRGPVKQRVSPKMLREAMATPEYRARMAGASTVSLNDLQTLSEKLQQSGDTEGAALLTRYIHEHGRQAKHSVYQTTSHSGKLIVHCHVFEAKLDEVPRDSVFHGAPTSPEAIHHELEKLVLSGKAKLFLDPRLIESKSNIPIRCFADGEFPVALHTGKSAKIEIRECRATFDILPTVIENHRIKIQLKLLSANEPSRVAGTLTPTASESSQGDSFCMVEMNFDEAFVHAFSHPMPGYGLFVVVETTPRF